MKYKKIFFSIIIILLILLLFILLNNNINLFKENKLINFNPKPKIDIDLKPYLGDLVEGDGWCVHYIDLNYISNRPEYENILSYNENYFLANPNIVCKDTNLSAKVYELNMENYKCDHLGMPVRSPKKVFFCGNYFTIYTLSSATGPLVFGPFYDGYLDLNDCKGAYERECYFIVATRNKSKEICNLIELDSMRNRCLNIIN